jgi:hypothetical protein
MMNLMYSDRESASLFATSVIFLKIVLDIRTVSMDSECLVMSLLVFIGGKSGESKMYYKSSPNRGEAVWGVGLPPCVDTTHHG